jgi:flagellar hook-basal body complex protein FliE
MIAIDTARIEAMAEQMRLTASRMQASQGVTLAPESAQVGSNSGIDFAKALKTHLDSLNQMQSQSKTLGEKFAMGDSSVSLSDVMIASQKANITLQATLQVRNKLVTAYHDIMNMPI